MLLERPDAFVPVQSADPDLLKKLFQDIMPTPADWAGSPTKLGLSSMGLTAAWADMFLAFNPYFTKYTLAGRYSDAATEITKLLAGPHLRPQFNIKYRVDGEEVPVKPETVSKTAFCNLLCFKPPRDHSHPLPKVLLVAPMSGHFATLVSDTIQTMLQDHDVYVTDWNDVSKIPLSEGKFGTDEYVGTVSWALETIGPGAHVVAVCQPVPQVLATAALMEEDDNSCQPLSMTLMAGPVDTRVNPGTVNELATKTPLEEFRKSCISMVRAPLAGEGRETYPAMLQLGSFMAMKPEEHKESFRKLFFHLVKGEREQAAKIIGFYKEFFACMDLSADFYLETVRNFQEHPLALGKLKVMYKGALRPVKLSAITRTRLLTVEGEKDHICPVGQTLAAHDLCTGIREIYKKHHMQPSVGHYGVFSGSRWRKSIYIAVRDFIAAAENENQSREMVLFSNISGFAGVLRDALRRPIPKPAFTTATI